MQEARTRYDRGQELFNDGAYEQAMLEFDRAYELAPASLLLFNVGQVALVLRDYPKAISAFEQYLCEMGDKVPEGRRDQVNEALDTAYGRIAYLEITADVEGTEIIVDDISRGTTPLDGPVIVNAGRHTIVGRKVGRLDARTSVTLAGLDRTPVKLEMLLPPTGEVRVVPVPGSEDKVVEEEDTYWIGWLVTGSLTAGAVVTGLLALDAQRDIDTALDGPTNPQDIQSLEDKRVGFAVATDVLAGLAVVSAGLSIWWTIADLDDGPADTPDEPAKKKDTALDLVVGPTSVSLQGTF